MSTSDYKEEENEISHPLRFFKQFGTIKRLRIARNRKTGKSKHFGFIEFESPEVAKVVAECMHNYLLSQHLLQVHLLPPERVHPNLWNGVNRWFKPIDWIKIERKRQDKERTLEDQKKLVEGIVKRDQKRRKRIEAAGIDYECPDIVQIVSTIESEVPCRVGVASDTMAEEEENYLWRMCIITSGLFQGLISFESLVSAMDTVELMLP